MKKTTLISFFVFVSIGLFAQDQTVNGSLIVKQDFITGNDAFNSTSEFIIRGPNKPFGIESKRDISFDYVTAGKSIIRAYRGDSYGNYMQFLTTDDTNGYTPSVRLHIHNDGKIGVGTLQPKYLFHVNGTFFAKDAVFGNNVIGSTAEFIIRGPNNPFGKDGKRDISFEFASAGKSIIRTYRGSGWGNYMQFLTTDNSGSTPYVRLHIHDNGKIGIGTEVPQSELDVRGKIIASEVEIKVLPTGGADFVFKPNYNLMPLSEVESYVQKNQHLPEIPSEKEMIENGLNVNEMQIKLLQKIEELTLYVIEQEKKIEKQNKRIKYLENTF